MNPRQIAALTDPISSSDTGHLARCRSLTIAENHTIISVVLAVDR